MLTKWTLRSTYLFRKVALVSWPRICALVGASLLAVGCSDPVEGDGYVPPAEVRAITGTPGIGDLVCDETRADLQGNVDGVIADAQAEVDRMIADNPALAAYADDTKRMLAEMEPDVRANLDDALAANGC